MKQRHYVIAIFLALLLPVVWLLATPNYGTPEKPSRASLQATSILKACESYRTHPKSGNKYPSVLNDLADPPFGGGSFLNDPQHDLIDPWSNPFKYALSFDSEGQPTPYVWTERIIDGKITLLGAKWINGKAETFGQ